MLFSVMVLMVSVALKSASFIHAFLATSLILSVKCFLLSLCVCACACACVCDISICITKGCLIPVCGGGGVAVIVQVAILVVVTTNGPSR